MARTKPDLRVKLEFTELTDVMKPMGLQGVLRPANMKAAASWPCASWRLQENGGISRGEIDAYTEFVKIHGAKGLAYIPVNEAAKAPDRRATRWPACSRPS